MKTGLLLSVMTVGVTIGAVVGGADAWAACNPTSNCENLGYKYCKSECPNGGTVCPFDSSKYFCFNPLTFTVTAEMCKAECKAVGTNSCIKNGTTYYESCGASSCSNGQICFNGTCKNPAPTSGLCCGERDCPVDEDECQSNDGIDCYSRCMKYYPDCGDMQESCRAQGGIPLFQGCTSGNTSYSANYAIFSCDILKLAPQDGFCCGYTSQCGYSGMSHSNDSYCQDNYGKGCYQVCRENTGAPDCQDVWASCRAQNGTPVFQNCGYYGDDLTNSSYWRCKYY